MPLSKELSLIEAKLDALLEKAGIKPDEIEAASPRGYGGRTATKLTKEEQQAIDNAPATPTATDMGMTEPMSRAARTEAVTNAPVTPAATEKPKGKK